MKLFRSVCLLFTCLHFCSLQSAERLSLAELIDIALKRNPETEKVWSNVKRAESVIGLTKSRNYPHLSAQGSLTHAREVKFPNGPNTTFTSYGGELSLDYLLFDFGENKAAVSATKEALKAATWWADFAIQKIMSVVASSYYEYLNAMELLKIKQDSLQDATMIMESAEELKKAGLRSENDYITAKATVMEMKILLAEQKAALAIAYGRLLNALSMPMDTQLEVDTDPQNVQDIKAVEGVVNLIALAEEQRADLLAKQAMIAEMDARIVRSKRAFFPKLRALGQAGWLEYGKHQGNGYNYSAGVALDVPIFKGFEHTYQKRHALADAEISAAELKELQNLIALEVLSYSESVKAAKEALSYSKEYFCEASRSYDHAMEGYKAGLLNIFDLLQSQRFLADARSRNARAKTQWLVSLAQLAFATGSLSK